jgi:hypothetical protein
MRATTPHECVGIHSYTLLSQQFCHHVPHPRLRSVPE